MKKFEYKVEEKNIYGHTGNPSDMLQLGSANEEKYLNDEGKKGWELVAIHHQTIGISHPTFYYFKREKDES
jgi:hypothetical protein